jgi:valyl-tRNA synthetase
MVVERQLNAAGTSRVALGREAFVERVWQWKEQSGGLIANQMRRLGASVDWQRDRFTMDPGLSQAVTEVFVRLYAEGLDLPRQAPGELGPGAQDRAVGPRGGCRGGRAASGTCATRSATAAGLVVATTRPETMLGDTAVAVHPDDERYRHLIGRRCACRCRRARFRSSATYVDPQFGSGCVKITPAHDFNDYEVGQRHGAAADQHHDARRALNDNVPAAIAASTAVVARERVVAELEAPGSRAHRAAPL